MDCRILRHVTLKSDGHLGCDDSVGYGINLGHVSMAPGWRLRDVLNGPIYTHVRNSFKENRAPWPGVCEGCDLLSSGAIPKDTLNERLELLVEPTLACTLSCACCLRRQIISKGRNTSSLDPAVLRRFLESCRSDSIAVDQVHYIGWGEPLMHGEFRELFDTVKSLAPFATQMVTTAGNVDFKSTVGNAPLDRLIVSCDGSRQVAYERYRRGGDFDTVIKFMRDCRKYGDPGVFLEWKYILFEFNDLDEDLLLAQQVAEEIGVDSLLFIITNSKWHSTRFTVDSSEQVPIRSLVASVSPAAAMNATAIACSQFSVVGNEVAGFGYIDTCTISVGKFLTVEGWAFDLDGSYAIQVELVVDGLIRARTRTSLTRIDVASAHTNSAGSKCGFLFRIPVDADVLPESVEVRINGSSGTATIGGSTIWEQRAVKRRRDLPTVAMPVTRV